MDIALLKTFLEVARLRHFGKAADRLFVTQSAVSARVKLLEGTLGVALFERRRNDIQLTAAGRRLYRRAEGIVNAWERARQELALEASLAIGFSAALWGILVRDWVLRLQSGWPDLALQLEVLTSAALTERIANGQLDLALSFEPSSYPGFEARQVRDIALVLVSTRAGQTASEALDGGYILVDWGVNFALAHASHFSDCPAPRLRVAHGGLALDLLAGQGGAAYLAEELAAPGLASGHLHRVAGAPVINRAAYVVFRVGRSDDALLRQVLDRI